MSWQVGYAYKIVCIYHNHVIFILFPCVTLFYVVRQVVQFEHF